MELRFDKAATASGQCGYCTRSGEEESLGRRSEEHVEEFVTVVMGIGDWFMLFMTSHTLIDGAVGLDRLNVDLDMVRIMVVGLVVHPS